MTKKVVKKVKSAVSKVKKSLAPKWTHTLLTTGDDIMGVCEYYAEFNIPMDPIMESIVAKIEAGAEFTLEDQKLFVRCLLGDFAKQTLKGFSDAMFSGISVEAADHLKRANKYGKELA